MRFLLATMLVLLCGQADAQYKVYRADIPVAAWTPGPDGSAAIGSVSVPVLLTSGGPPAATKIAYAGGGQGPFSTTTGGVPITPVGVGMSISEHPVAPGAMMTVLVANCGASSLRSVGHDSAQYEGNPPLSGIVTVNLVGASVLNRFPASITLTPDTINYVP